MTDGPLFIFLEDKQERDRSFLEAFLLREFAIKLPDDSYIKTDSWTGIKREDVIQQLRFNEANGGKI